MATKPCDCAHPSCGACRGKCQTPMTQPVRITYLGERKGDFRFCEPCTKEWQVMPDMTVDPIL
jgi:hypothetical protein